LFTVVKAAQACDQIVQQIEQMIAAGRLNLGERLPSERALAKQFRVSRMTLRRAVQLLENRGLVETRSGRGTFVSQLGGQIIAPVVVADVSKSGEPLIENGR